jgi:hypothetical protein
MEIQMNIPTKSEVLLRDVINHYHPEFYRSADIRNLAKKHPEYFNVERLIEECMAHVGGYRFVDCAHYDFSDRSDSKTASIRSAPRKPGSVSHAGEIAGVTSAGGGLKAGDLRCVVFNPLVQGGALRYYYLPRSWWTGNIIRHPTSGVGKITYSYNRTQDHIQKFLGYECADFEELAKTSSMGALSAHRGFTVGQAGA